MHETATISSRKAYPEGFARTLGRVADPILGSRGCLFTFHRGAASHVWESLPNRDFYVDLGFLERFISYLVRGGWAIVTVEEALERATRNRSSDRYVNFSIDDAYRDTFEDVVPLFRKHGVPVTVFVATQIPDGTLPLWAAGVEDFLLHADRVALDDGIIEVPTREAKRQAFARIARAFDGPQAGARYASFCRLNGIDAGAMHWKHAISWEMLEALSYDPLVEIGSHTVSHPRISSLEPRAAFAELKDSRDRLRTRLGLAVNHFAFPYGRSGDCGPRDFALAREAGFASAATTVKGLLRRGHDPFSLPRNTLNGSHQNLTMMEMHMTGLTGAAARILGRV